jgi:hypothetical protein
MESKPCYAFRALILLACVLLVARPLYGQKAEPLPDEPRPGWQERDAKMEEELKRMQEEAAKNPNRPSMEALRSELDEMAAERDGAFALQRRWLISSCALNFLLALALVGILVVRRGARAKGTVTKDDGRKISA